MDFGRKIFLVAAFYWEVPRRACFDVIFFYFSFLDDESHHLPRPIGVFCHFNWNILGTTPLVTLAANVKIWFDDTLGK